MKILSPQKIGSLALSLLLITMSSCIFSSWQRTTTVNSQESVTPTKVDSSISLDKPNTLIPLQSTLPTVLPATQPIEQLASEETSTPTPTVENTEIIHCSSLEPLDLSSLTFGVTAEWSGNRELYTIQADGSNMTRITTTGRVFSTMVWSPDAKTMLAWEASSHKIFLVEVANGQVQDFLATLAPDLDIVPPFSWSPDGLKIAFTAIDKKSQELADLYVLELSTMGLTRISFPEGYEQNADNPLWSPDGQYILYTANGWGVNSTSYGRGRLGLVALYRLSDQTLNVFGLEPGFDWEMAELWVAPNRFITLAHEMSTIPFFYQITMNDSMEVVKRKPLQLAENAQISRDGQFAIEPNHPENGQWIFNITNLSNGESMTLDLPITELVDFSWGYDNRVFAVLTQNPGDITYNLNILNICTRELRLVVQGINSFSWKP